MFCFSRDFFRGGGDVFKWLTWCCFSFLLPFSHWGDRALQHFKVEQVAQGRWGLILAEPDEKSFESVHALMVYYQRFPPAEAQLLRPAPMEYRLPKFINVTHPSTPARSDAEITATALALAPNEPGAVGLLTEPSPDARQSIPVPPFRADALHQQPSAQAPLFRGNSADPPSSESSGAPVGSTSSMLRQHSSTCVICGSTLDPRDWFCGGCS